MSGEGAPVLAGTILGGPIAQVALEGALLALLLVVAVLGWRLDRRLAALRNGGDGVRAALHELSDTITRAEAAIAALRAARDLGAAGCAPERETVMDAPPPRARTGLEAVALPPARSRDRTRGERTPGGRA